MVFVLSWISVHRTNTIRNLYNISSFYLGVPMEVMGLMLGEFVDEYTVRVIDVFAMPQSGRLYASK